MSCIRFKFKSSLEYDKVTFDGLQLSVGELRKKIMTLKKLGVSDDFTLQIMDSQSRKIYSNDSEMVPRNTSVIIMRIPMTSSHKLPKTQFRENGLSKDNGFIPDLKKTGDLAGANATEEEKILAMMSQAGEDYNPANYAKFKPRQGGFGSNLVKQPPPSNYVCHRCGLKGHWIKFCPTNGDPSYDNPRIKAPSGIPKAHVVSVTTDTVGAMKDRQGNLVKRRVDIIATGDMKMKSVDHIDTSVPPELTCNICKELIRDAVIIPCCGESFCDECIREYLLENDFKCFACEETDVSPDTLAPNKRLRNDAKKFQSQITQKKRLAVTRGLPAIAVTQQPYDTPTSNKLSDDDIIPSSLPKEDSSPRITSSFPLSPSSTTEGVPSPVTKTTEDEPISESARNEVISQENPSSTPPITRIKSPIAMTTSSSYSSIQITKPITLSSNTRPITTTANYQAALLSTPLLTTVPHSLGVPTTSLIQSSLYPQPLTNSLLHGLPMSYTVPPVHPIIPSQSSTNSLLLQAAAINNQKSLDASQMARLTELLVAAETRKKSPSPAPLSFEEFQRQQKVLRGLDIPVVKSRSISRASSYSSLSYSTGSRSPSPRRRRRSRSRNFSPHRYDGRSYSPSRHDTHHRRRRHSPFEQRRRRSVERYEKEERKSHKRKHHTKHSECLSPPPCTDEGEETKAKRHKKKKHRHPKSDKDDRPLSPPAVISNKDLLTDSQDNIKLGENSEGLDPIQSTPDPAMLISADLLVPGSGSMDTASSHSPFSKADDVIMKAEPANVECDTDTLSGGSTPVLPQQESLGPSSLNEDKVILVKRKKHKEKGTDKERKRRHKKHRRHKEASHDKSSSKKKSRKRID